MREFNDLLDRALAEAMNEVMDDFIAANADVDVAFELHAARHMLDKEHLHELVSMLVTAVNDETDEVKTSDALLVMFDAGVKYQELKSQMFTPPEA